MSESDGVELKETQGEVSEFSLDLGTVGKPNRHIQHISYDLGDNAYAGECGGDHLASSQGPEITIVPDYNDDEIYDRHETLNLGEWGEKTDIVMLIRHYSYSRPPIELKLGDKTILTQDLSFAEAKDGSFRLSYVDPSTYKQTFLTGQEIYDSATGELPNAIKTGKDIRRRASESSEPVSAAFSGIKLKINPPKS